MRIGYNARFLGAPLTGVQRVAQDLFETLVCLDRSNEYVVFRCGREDRRLAAFEASNVTVVEPQADRRGALHRHLWEERTLPRLIGRAGLDVMHHPANTAPLRGLDRAVVSVYDTSFLAHPEWFSRSFRLLYRNLIPRICRRAARIITSSAFSKSELDSRLGLPPSSVVVIHPAVSPAVATLCRSQSDAPKPVDPPFVLFVGGMNPRKNLVGLLAAMRILAADPGHRDVRLRVVGGSPGIYGKGRGSAAVPVNVDVLGAVDDAALISLYRQAACLCYPSLYEGFGLPPLEAMAAGAPVVASDIPVLREVLGEAAVFAPPTDPQALAEALARVLSDADLCDSLRRRGAQRVSAFTWDIAARKTLEVYAAVAARA